MSASAERSAGDQLAMLAERERDLEVLLERVDAQRLEPARLRGEPRRPVSPCSAGPRQSASADATASAAAVTSPSRSAARVSREQLLEADRVDARSFSA